MVSLQSLNDTEKRYRELQMKVESVGGESGGLGNINQKAKDMKKEAQDLLNKARNGIEQLKSESSQLLWTTWSQALKARHRISRNQVPDMTLAPSHLTSVSDVAELEKKFKNNEQRMQKQRMELDELRQNATVARDKIREHVQLYSSCD